MLVEVVQQKQSDCDSFRSKRKLVETELEHANEAIKKLLREKTAIRERVILLDETEGRRAEDLSTIVDHIANTLSDKLGVVHEVSGPYGIDEEYHIHLIDLDGSRLTDLAIMVTLAYDDETDRASISVFQKMIGEPVQASDDHGISRLEGLGYPVKKITTIEDIEVNFMSLMRGQYA